MDPFVLTQWLIIQRSTISFQPALVSHVASRVVMLETRYGTNMSMSALTAITSPFLTAKVVAYGLVALSSMLRMS